MESGGEGYYKGQSAIGPHSSQREGQEATPIEPDWIDDGHFFRFLCYIDSKVRYVFGQMGMVYRKFYEVWHRIHIQGYHFAFIARIEQVYKFGKEVLDLEARNIWVEVMTMHKYQKAIAACIIEQTGDKIEWPNLDMVRRSAAQLIDRITNFQSQMYDSFAKPLGCIEMDLHGMIMELMEQMMRAASVMTMYYPHNQPTSYWQTENLPPSTLPLPPSSTVGKNITTATSTPMAEVARESGLPYAGDFVQKKPASC